MDFKENFILLIIFLISFTINAVQAQFSDCQPLEIPINGTISYENTVGNNSTYGTVATLSCNPLNFVSGPSTSTCVDYEWYPTIGRCTSTEVNDTPCPNPIVINGSITYGHGTPSDTTRPSLTTATLTCQNEYILTGSSTSTCINGTFTPRLGSCTFEGSDRFTCSTPYVAFGKITFDNGKPDDLTRQIGTLATLSCLPGYSVYGNPFSVCSRYNQKASFQPSLGTCLVGYGRSTCTEIFENNGVVTYNKDADSNGRFPQFTVATLTCDNGYIIEGSSISRCSDSSFSRLGRCVLNVSKTVPEPMCDSPYIINGQLSFSQGDPYDIYRRQNTIVTLTCKSGYTLIGESQSTCTNTSFIPTLGSCLFGFGNGTECPNPTASNGQIVYSIGEVIYNVTGPNVPLSTKLRLECDSGYRVRGIQNAVCISGEITPQLGICTASQDYSSNSCSHPDIKYGDVHYEFNRLNVIQLTLTCYDGYTLQGANVSICSREEGIFNPPLGNCTFEGSSNPCTIPYVINGYIQFGGRWHNGLTRDPGTKAYVTCNHGFELNGASNSTCINGEFTPPIGTCTPARGGCSSLLVFNGMVHYDHGSEYEFYRANGTIATLKCNYGYKLNGESQSTCLNGVFAPSIGTCELLTEACANLFRHSGNIHYSSYSFSYWFILTTHRLPGTKASLVCASEHRPSGPTEAECINGEFTPTLGTCIYDGSCPSPSVRKGHIIYSHGNIFDTYRPAYSTATRVCPKGEAVNGTSIATCTNGSFRPFFGECAEFKVCETPKVQNGTYTFSKGSVLDTTRPVGTIAILTCNKGYVPARSSIGTCTYYSDFDFPYMPCIVATPVTPCGYNWGSNGKYTFTEADKYLTYPPGTVGTLTCYPGYSINGSNIFSSQATCTNGSFIPTFGTCSRIGLHCSAINAIIGGSVTYTNGEWMGQFPDVAIAIASCNSGEAITGNSTATCSNGIWNPPMLGTCSLLDGSLY